MRDPHTGMPRRIIKPEEDVMAAIFWLTENRNWTLEQIYCIKVPALFVYYEVAKKEHKRIKRKHG